MNKISLNFEIANELIKYYPIEGKFSWKERDRKWFKTDSAWKKWNSLFSGQEAFITKNAEGYYTATIFRKTYKAHRIAWLLTHGEWPDYIDHKNRDRGDNRIDNLRNVDRIGNGRNLSKYSTNTSGHIGVSFRKESQKWRVIICVNYKNKFYGDFISKEEAIKVSLAKRAELGFSKDHGGERPK